MSGLTSASPVSSGWTTTRRASSFCGAATQIRDTPSSRAAVDFNLFIPRNVAMIQQQIVPQMKRLP